MTTPGQKGAILEAVGLGRDFAVRKPLFGKARVVRAVEGVDLEVRQGETLAIVGESGCGKSTLARLLVRLMTPTAGAVMYQGKNIADLSAEEVRGLRRELQFIFQDPFSSLNPRMTVGDLIAEPLRTHNLVPRAERPARVARLLTRVGLRPSDAQRYPHEFSGGQRQRVGIARALASGPKVLVGDEPVSALDVSIQAQVVNILQDLKAEFGLTLVIIAHDLAVIRHMADRVAVMYLGQIVEMGPVAEVFAAPRHPYTEALIASIPLPMIGARRARVQVTGELADPAHPPRGCRFHTRCRYAVGACARTAPKLADPWALRQVACHRAQDLELVGLTAAGGQRSPEAAKRFEMYRAARAAQADQVE